MSSMGEKISQLRLNMGLNRPQLAREANVSYSFLVQVETGQRESPQVDKLACVAKVLGVTVDLLLDPEAQLPAVENNQVRELRKELLNTINTLDEGQLVRLSELMSPLIEVELQVRDQGGTLAGGR
jgi:transcriptional regulator with XRE-family HTH domain